MLRVRMVPDITGFGKSESGIKRVVEAYYKYLPKYGIELVHCHPDDLGGYDVALIHAGTADTPPEKPLVASIHGLYWTADYPAIAWEWRANSHVIESVRHANKVTVPSRWVAETLERDMRFSPYVIPHGIEWDEWQHDREPGGYVLWNKNRGGVDVCDPYPVTDLALRFPNIPFITTFSRKDPPKNVTVCGIQKHEDMKVLVQSASVYLSTTKETFGIGILEALASGTPVLGFAQGGILDLVKHGVSGYLAAPNDYQDLAQGLEYCLANRDQLSKNCRQLAKQFVWDIGVAKMADVIRAAAVVEPPSVTVVIPCYNKEKTLGRAVESALNQTYPPSEVIIVDDGSTDGSQEIGKMLSEHEKVRYIRQDNAGVANARNAGIAASKTKYVCPLDADDKIAPQFLEACVPELEKDHSLGIAYTGLWYKKPGGEEGLSPWPGEFDYNKQLKKQNQIPTCCVFRKEMWERLGGYKQRYAPGGAGAEDAEFWLRAGAYGWGAKKVTDAGLFIYSWMSGIVSGNPDYKEVDWLSWHPWTWNDKPPFASRATPKKWSHPVRQYDEPVVSVVIPVGPGHERIVETALDSLEAQTEHRWEAIVVNDTGKPLELPAYPYAKMRSLGNKGAGAARNLGASIARAPFLLFLDADDYLVPRAIEMMLSAWTMSGAIIYSDYIGRGIYGDVGNMTEAQKRRLVDFRDGEAAIVHKANEFDYRRAMDQPQNPPYIWCNITSLIPKEWHRKIGGFDETMPSWEDWDYWLRLAWAGYQFHRIPEPLLVYKFYTGKRRNASFKQWDTLITYIEAKKNGLRKEQ